MLYGINIDDIYSIKKYLPLIKELPKKPTARIVIDNDADMSDYEHGVKALAPFADIMIQVNDSYDEKSLGLSEYVNKAKELLSIFGQTATLWEVGNEVNGDWLSAKIWEKVEATLEVFRAAGHQDKTVVTYFLDEWMVPWIRDHKKLNFEWVMLSCYAGNQRELDKMVRELPQTAALLKDLTGAPNFAVGEYGEDEWGGGNKRRIIPKLITEFEKYPGAFYWNFQKRFKNGTSSSGWAELVQAWNAR